MATKSLARVILGLSLALFIFCGAALSQGGSEAVDGAAAYKKRCAMCHGPEGKGFKALKTPDFTSPEWQAAHSDEEITEVIKNGKKGTAMPALGSKMSEDEIKAVVAHVRTFNSEKK